MKRLVLTILSLGIALGALVSDKALSASTPNDDQIQSTTQKTISITVNNVNRTPTITNPGNKTGTEGVLITFTVTGSDLDSADTLTLSANGLPSGATFATKTGTGTVTQTFNWTPSSTQGLITPYSVTFNVVDNGQPNKSASVTIQITVSDGNHAPTCNTIPTQTVDENKLLTVTPVCTDPDSGDILSYAGTNLPTGASVSATTGVLTWTPSYTQAGTYSNITITAKDNSNATGAASFTITAINVNRPPTVSPAIISQTFNEGQTGVDVSLTFNDPDGDPLNVSSIALEDKEGDALSAFMSIDMKTVSGANGSARLHFVAAGYADAKIYNNLRVKISDTYSTPATGYSNDFTVTVNNVNRAPACNTIAPQTVNENSLLTVTPSCTDLDNDPLTYTGTNLPTGASVSATTGVLTWTPSYSQAGTYSNITITAKDNSNETGAASFTITAINVNRPPTVSPAIISQTFNEGQTGVDVSLTFNDPDGDPLNVSSIALEDQDGDALPGFMSLDMKTASGANGSARLHFVAAGYADAKIYNNLRVKISDTYSTPATGYSNDFTVTVNNVNRAPACNTIAPQTVNENSLLTVTPSCTDLDNDPLTYAGTNLPTGASVSATTGVLTWTPSYTQAGTYSNITITAKDNSNATGSASFTTTVANVNRLPYFFETTTSYTVQETTQLSFIAKAKDDDADTNDLVDISLVSGPSWVSANNPSPANPVSMNLTANPPSGSIGNYTVTLQAYDNKSGQSSLFSIALTVTQYSCTGPVRMYNASDKLVGCYTQIQSALDDVKLDNNFEIKVDAGSYTPITFNKNKIITVESTSSAANTIIDGNNVGTVVTFTKDAAPLTPGIILKGFTIQNGHSTINGGGILMQPQADNITIQDCTLLNNIADQKGSSIYVDQTGFSTKKIYLNNITVQEASQGGGGGGKDKDIFQ